MPTAAATFDPANAITAAVRELYEQLREIVDRGPTDDPGLLDELGKLTGRIRGRITRAKKRAAAAAEPKPAEKPPDQPLPGAGKPTDEPSPRKGLTSSPVRNREPAIPPKALPAAVPPERVSVRLDEPEQLARGLLSAGNPFLRRPQVVVALVLLGAVLIAVTGNPLVVLGGAAVAQLARVGLPQLVRRIRAGAR